MTHTGHTEELEVEAGEVITNLDCMAAMVEALADTKECINGSLVSDKHKMFIIIWIWFFSGQASQDSQNNGDLQTQPPMLTLKQFLANQDDSISDSDAITKYNEYKQDFRRQQLNEFFVTHKDEEWWVLCVNAIN